LGLTYKPGTSTLRRSAALEIISLLVREGVQVNAHDPRADREELQRYTEFRFFEDVYRAVEDARALVVITGWPEYRELAFDRIKRVMAEPLIIDTANMLDAELLTGMGFTYLDVGRGRRGVGER
jgi:UDPglucose 6-dehydrogenase